MVPGRPFSHDEHPIIASIRAAAAKRGLKAHQIAKAAGLGLYTVQRLLAGEGSPTLATLQAVCSVISIDLVARPKKTD